MNTKKLVLVEYDESGNEVDRNVLAENKDLLTVFNDHTYFIKGRYLLDKRDRETFTEEQWDILDEYAHDETVTYWIEKNEFRTFHHATLEKEQAALWYEFFKESVEKRNYVLGLLKLKIYAEMDAEASFPYDVTDLRSCWEWVNKTSGVYQYVENDGKVWCTFHAGERPTRKQAAYQRKKRGVRLVFLNFTDWKKYAVSEGELA